MQTTISKLFYIHKVRHVKITERNWNCQKQRVCVIATIGIGSDTMIKSFVFCIYKEGQSMAETYRISPCISAAFSMLVCICW